MSIYEELIEYIKNEIKECQVILGSIHEKESTELSMNEIKLVNKKLSTICKEIDEFKSIQIN